MSEREIEDVPALTGGRQITNSPRAPNKGSTSAEAWLRYYCAMATWYEESAEIISSSLPKSTTAVDLREQAIKCHEIASSIELGTHHKVSTGEWR